MKRSDKKGRKPLIMICFTIILVIIIAFIGVLIYKRNVQSSVKEKESNFYNQKDVSKKPTVFEKLFSDSSTIQFGDSIKLRKEENQLYKIQYEEELASAWNPEEEAKWEECAIRDNVHKKIRILSGNVINTIESFAELSVSQHKMYIFKNNSGNIGLAFPNTRAHLPEEDNDVMLVAEQNKSSNNEVPNEEDSVNGVFPPNATHTVLVISSSKQATPWLNDKENSYKYKVTNNRESNNSSDLISEHSEKLPNSRTSYGTQTSVYFWVTPDTAEYLGSQREYDTIIFYKATEDFINK